MATYLLKIAIYYLQQKLPVMNLKAEVL